jgi:hypothetical protein
MPNIRIGFGTDFNLTNEQIGIGLTNQSVRLQVAGNIRAERLITTGSGINTFYAYDGFLNDKQESDYDLSIDITDKGNLNSLSGEIVINGEVTVSDDTPLTGGRLDSLTVTGKFDLPHGGTKDREDTPEKGSTRFNQDLGQLEFYTGYEWRTVNSYADSGRGRGVFGGGGAPSGYSTPSAIIDYVQISTLGNALDFGTLTVARNYTASSSSETRGTYAGGGSYLNTIDYITLASTGNAIDFGDLTISLFGSKGCSSSTRGLFGGGYVPAANTNVISYIQFATIGNAVDFGDLVIPRRYNSAVSSPTRGIFAGGISPTNDLLIDYVTISSTGNAVTFGNLQTLSQEGTGSSSSTRGIIYGSSNNKTINYITISTLGNALNFGDLSFNRSGAGSCSNQVRSIIGGGFPSPALTQLNSIEYVTISTAGNSQDFGDLTRSTSLISACSDSHGGLGGF